MLLDSGSGCLAEVDADIDDFDLRGETEARKQEILGEIREELRQKIKPVDVWPMYDIYLSRIDEPRRFAGAAGQYVSS